MTRSISIGMPNYNNESTIERAIRSALTSKRVKQLVFFDNCSTDRSIEVVKKLEADYPDVQFVISLQKENVGRANNFKDVYFHSREYYFAWLAPDDFVSDGYYDQLAQSLDNTEVGFSAGSTVFQLPNAQEQSARSNRPLLGNWHERLRRFLSNPCENQWCYGVFRREQIHDAVNHLDESAASDWFMMIRMLEQGEFQHLENCIAYRTKSETRSYFSAEHSPAIYYMLTEGSPVKLMLEQTISVVSTLNFEQSNLLALLKLYVRKIMELVRYNTNLITDKHSFIQKAERDFNRVMKQQLNVPDDVLKQLVWQYPW